MPAPVYERALRTAGADNTLEGENVAIGSRNVTEARRFMQGLCHVAIISDAASTGISLHASKIAAAPASRFRRRVHLTLELAWSAQAAIQVMG